MLWLKWNAFSTSWASLRSPTCLVWTWVRQEMNGDECAPMEHAWTLPGGVLLDVFGVYSSNLYKFDAELARRLLRLGACFCEFLSWASLGMASSKEAALVQCWISRFWPVWSWQLASWRWDLSVCHHGGGVRCEMLKQLSKLSHSLYIYLCLSYVVSLSTSAVCYWTHLQ